MVYAEDRKAFALAGGFDIGRGPVLALQLLLFGGAWATTKLDHDPLGFARSPWVYLGVSAALGLLATYLFAERVFGGRTRRRSGSGGFALGPRITFLTGQRLELTQRTIPLRLAGGALLYGGAVYVFVAADGWRAYAGAALVGLIATIPVAVASDSHVVVDKRAGQLLRMTRNVWRRGRVEVLAVPLDRITAVVSEHQAMATSHLVNVCVRADGHDVRVVDGARMLARARNIAGTIGTFLEVPVIEDDRLLAPDPELPLVELPKTLEGMMREAQRRGRP
jgi:hypothetical protein